MRKSTKILLVCFVLANVLSAVFARYVLQGIVPNGTAFVFEFSTLGYVGLAAFAVSMILSAILFIRFIRSQKLYGAIFFSILPLTLFYVVFVVFISSAKEMNDITSLSIKSTLNLTGNNLSNNYLWVGVATIAYVALLFSVLFVLCKPLANILSVAQRLGDGRVRYENYKVGGGKQFREIEHSLNKINYNFRAKENKIRKYDLRKTLTKTFYQFAGKNGVFELECGNEIRKNAALICLNFDSNNLTKNGKKEGAIFANSHMVELENCARKFGGFAGCINENSYVFIFASAEKAIEYSGAFAKAISAKGRQTKDVDIVCDWANVTFVIDENDLTPKLKDFSFDFLQKLKEISKKFEAKIIFSKNILKNISQNFNFDFRYLIDVDGVSIYENLVSYRPILKSKIKRFKNQFENAVQLYQNGEYKCAREQFSQILKVVPADKATFAYFNLSAEKIVDAV